MLKFSSSPSFSHTSYTNVLHSHEKRESFGETLNKSTQSSAEASLGTIMKHGPGAALESLLVLFFVRSQWLTAAGNIYIHGNDRRGGDGWC